MVPLPRTTTTTTGNAIQKAKKNHQAPPKQTPHPTKNIGFAIVTRLRVAAMNPKTTGI